MVVNLLIDFFHQMVTTAARRKISFHLGVPSLLAPLFEPVCQFSALGLGQIFNCGLNRFHGYNLSLAFFDDECKPTEPDCALLVSAFDRARTLLLSYRTGWVFFPDHGHSFSTSTPA